MARVLEKGLPEAPEADHMIGMQPKIAIVDDEPEVQLMMTRYLAQHGFYCVTAGSGRALWSEIAEGAPDLVVLDLNLPGEDGLDLARALRARYPAIGIIMVTGRRDEADRVAGLELGADDYVVKPFSLRELVARVKTVLRRMARPAATPAEAVPAGQWVSFAHLRLDLDHGRLESQDGTEISLTPSEFGLLKIFVANVGCPLSRADLQARLGHSSGRSVDVQITRLRTKIERAPRFPEIIRTVRGNGYLFAPEVVAVASPS